MGDLSEHFSFSEMECKCGCGYKSVHRDLVRVLEQIRTHFGAPVTINSGCRCPTHNKSVGGGKKSQHLYGKAADITVRNVTPDLVQELCDQIDVPGVGSYDTFTHVDVRDGNARW